MSYAIKADISIEINEGNLYADNRIVENLKEFKSGKLSLNGDHLSYEVQSMILGHKLSDITAGSGKKLTARGDDSGKYVGVGFYSTTLKNNARNYRAIWLHKVKFGVPNESLETKGDSITFQTPTIEGTVLTDIQGVWKDEAIFPTEQAARSWLNEQAGIEEEPAEPEEGDG